MDVPDAWSLAAALESALGSRYQSTRAHDRAGGDDATRIGSFLVSGEQLLSECEALSQACEFDAHTLKMCRTACGAAHQCLLVDARGLLQASDRRLAPHSMYGILMQLPNLSQRFAALGGTKALDAHDEMINRCMPKAAIDWLLGK